MNWLQEMGWLQVYAYYTGCNFFLELSIILVILSFLDYPILWKKAIALAVILDLIGAMPSVYLAQISNGRLWVLFLADNLTLLANGTAVFLAFERDWKKAVIASGLGYACYYQIYVGSFYIISVFGSFFSILGCLVLCFGAGMAMRRLRIADCVDYFIKDKRKGKLLLAITLLMAESWYVYQFLSRWVSGLAELFVYQTWLLTAIFLMALLYITFYARHKQREDAQEAILMQQRLYIESLEELEREVRMYRHDYKNMLSGMMLSASEGDMKAIQEFLKNSAGSFEEAVGKKIQQTTQLANLRQTELKSLVLAKLAQMHNLGISCHFEAAWPVDKVRMNPLDLNRCVGILVDNAMEEAGKHENGRVEMIFSNQDGCLTILVENTVGEDVDLSRLFKEGYSTKGTGRGIGLASYARLVDKYKNVMSMTSIRDGKLIQELKIS